MTIPPSGGAGLAAGPPAGASPYAVTAPPELVLAAADRTGRTTFTITNLTGRPVRTRLLPRGRGGASSDWLSVAGLPEVPVGVAGTFTADVQVRVPPDVPPGQYTFYLEVVAEDDTETVTGQTVAFTVPPAPPTPSRKPFPWLLVIIAAAVLLLIVGLVLFFVLRDRDAPPVNTNPPLVAGTPRVGLPLTASDGVWTGKDIQFTRQWRRCDATGNGCADIAGATQTTYTPVTEDAGSTLRIRVTATSGSRSATADSDPAGPVTAASTGLTVPPVVGLTLDRAQRVLLDVGLRASVRFSSLRCNPLATVTAQDPPADTPVRRGSVVTITVPTRNAPGCRP